MSTTKKICKNRGSDNRRFNKFIEISYTMQAERSLKCYALFESGISTTTVVPFPLLLFTPMVPLCISIIRLAIASPRPYPSESFFDRDASPPKKISQKYVINPLQLSPCLGQQLKVSRDHSFFNFHTNH